MYQDRENEILVLHSAISRFEEAMFRRVIAKMFEDYSGWNGESDFAMLELFEMLESKVSLCDQDFSAEEHMKHVVDIGALAAFIYYRLSVFGLDKDRALNQASRDVEDTERKGT